jgi:hypothetical protein
VQIGVRRNPLASQEIVFHSAVACGTMIRLADETKLKLRATVAGDREPYRVVGAPLRQSRTARCITQIAKFPQFFLGRFVAFMARCATMTGPSSTQREPRRMKPSAVFQLVGRHEEWTSHSVKLLFKRCGHCTQRGKRPLVSKQIQSMAFVARPSRRLLWGRPRPHSEGLMRSQQPARCRRYKS